MMLSNALVRPQSRLICRSRILSALNSVRPSRSPPNTEGYRKVLEGGETHPIRFGCKFGQRLDASDKHNSTSNILEKIDELERNIESEYHKARIEKPAMFRFCCLVCIASILALVLDPRRPLLFRWPSVLKKDIKSAQRAISRNDSKAGVYHMSKAWLMIQSLPPEMLSPDPNLKLLKVASLLAIALNQDGQHTDACRVLSDALLLRRKRMDEERRIATADRNGQKPLVSITKEERSLVITTCLTIMRMARNGGPENDEMTNYYLAYAYAESLRLSGSRDALSRERLYSNQFLPIDPIPLVGFTSELDLEYDRATHDVGEEELCHASSWWQEFLLTYPVLEESQSDNIDRSKLEWELMALSCEEMGDYWEGHKQLVLAYNTFSIALILLGDKKGEDKNYHVLRLMNKFYRVSLDLLESKRFPDLPTAQDVAKILDEIHPHVGVTELWATPNRLNAPEVARFYVTHGRTYLMMGQKDVAAASFKRGLELARTLKSPEVEKLAFEGLRAAEPRSVIAKAESTSSEDDNAPLQLRL